MSHISSKFLWQINHIWFSNHRRFSNNFLKKISWNSSETWRKYFHLYPSCGCFYWTFDLLNDSKNCMKTIFLDSRGISDFPKIFLESNVFIGFVMLGDTSYNGEIKLFLIQGWSFADLYWIKSFIALVFFIILWICIALKLI